MWVVCRLSVFCEPFTERAFGFPYILASETSMSGVRAKLKNTNTTPKLTSGTFRCNSTHGCLTCPYIDDARTSYTFSNAGETRQIKQHITCNSTNLTYMIECKKCKKQYIGETKRTIQLHSSSPYTLQLTRSLFCGHATYPSRTTTHHQCLPP